MKHVIEWFEISVTDLEKAKAFYTAVVNAGFEDMPVGGNPMAAFRADEGAVSGALWEDKNHTGAENSVMIYLTYEGDIEAALDRVEANGGRIIRGVTLIDEDIGWYAQFADPDGNPIGLYKSIAQD